MEEDKIVRIAKNVCSAENINVNDIKTELQQSKSLMNKTIKQNLKYFGVKTLKELGELTFGEFFGRLSTLKENAQNNQLENEEL